MIDKDSARLVFLIGATACVLLGLAELSRLVVLRCISTGWKVKFCLELTAYAVGGIWTFSQFLEKVRSYT